MELIGLLVGGAGILGFLGTILTLLSTRRKTRAEIEKLLSETQMINIEAQNMMQDEINELRKQNNELFADRKAHNLEKEKLREELNRLHGDIESLRRELQLERERNILLQRELEVKTASLKQLSTQNESDIQKANADIGKIKKQTGQLPNREDLSDRL